MAEARATQPTEAERERLRRDLEALRGELRAALDASEQDARPVELDQPAIGRVSRIDAIQQQKMLAANRSAQRARLAQVHAALERFEEETYGDCLACGETVGFARLEARPESLYCITCQSARERR